MERRTLRGAALSVSVLVVLAILAVSGVDWGRMAEVLREADVRLVIAGIVVSLFAQVAWGVATATSLRTVHASIPVRRAVFGYLTGTFAKQVLPFGHAGGIPLVSYVLADDLDLDYESTFAAVSASELIVFVGSVATAVAGLVLFLATGPRTPELTAIAALLGGLIAVIAVAAVLLLRRQELLVRAGLVAAVLGRRTIGRVIPGVERKLGPEAVRGGFSSFFATFSRATTDRRTLVVVGSAAVVGWLSFSLPLYLGFLAVGARLPLAAALLVVPLSGVLTLVPTPGGLGGNEIGTTAAVVVLTGTNVEVAASAVVLHRLCTYWVVVLAGGLSSLYLSIDVGEVTASVDVDAD